MPRPRFMVLHVRTLALAALLCGCALTFWVLAAHAPGLDRPRLPLTGRLIMIDPGHGGIDGGCGSAGVLEKSVNLAVAKTLEALLKQQGADVYLTRERDVALDPLYAGPGSRHARDLRARVQLAQQKHVELMVSLHVNTSSAANARGVFGFYRAGNAEGQRLADLLIAELGAAVGDSRRRVQPARFYVVRAMDAPSALIEMGFITNAQDRALLTSDDGRMRIAQALAKAISTFLLDPEAGKSTKAAPASTATEPTSVHPTCGAL